MWKDMLPALFTLGSSSALHVFPLTYAVYAYWRLYQPMTVLLLPIKVVTVLLLPIKVVTVLLLTDYAVIVLDKCLC